MNKIRFILSFLIIITFGSIYSFASSEVFSQKYKAVYVPQGKILTFSLESDLSAGYSWYLSKITNKRVIVFVKKEVRKGRKPGPVIEEWSFKTLNSGESIILLEYRLKKQKDAQQKIEYRIFVR